jgi:CarD family transcriptional regulator
VRLTVGSKVIYPNQGPCLIGSIVQRVIAGSSVSFYQLALLDDSGGELFVPVDKARSSGLRSLLSRAELPRLLSQLKQPTGAAKDWRQRNQDNLNRFASGSAFDLAEVIQSLTQLSERKELSFHESRMLDKARRLLVGELAEVLRETKSAAEELINQALHAGK